MLKLPVAVTKMSAYADHVVERLDLVALHRRLQRADRVDLGDDHAAALAAQRLGASLAHFAEAEHDGDLAAEHDVGGAVEAVDDRVPAAVDVVELALGHRVVDVDGGEHQRALLLHLVEAVHAGRRLLADAADRLGDRRPAARVRLQLAADRVEDDAPLLGILVRVERRHLAGLLELGRPCARTASRRRRHRRSARDPGRRATPAPRSCTTSTPRASRPSTRTPGSPSGSAGVPPVSGRPTTTAAAA